MPPPVKHSRLSVKTIVKYLTLSMEHVEKKISALLPKIFQSYLTVSLTLALSMSPFISHIPLETLPAMREGVLNYLRWRTNMILLP